MTSQWEKLFLLFWTEVVESQAQVQDPPGNECYYYFFN